METYRKLESDTTDPIFGNFNLSELTLVKKGNSKKLAFNGSVNIALNHIVKEYGIYIGGSTWVLKPNLEETDFVVLYSTITKDFPIENESIIRQLYGYDNAVINIGVGGLNNWDCAYSFYYDLDNYTCVLCKMVYGTTETSRNFASLNEMLQALNLVEDVENIFDVIDAEA